MPPESLRDLIRAAEHAEPPEQWALLCFLAGRGVTTDEHELNAALRRSQLLLAAGGDPRRRLELYGRAVTALAAFDERAEPLWALAQYIVSRTN